MSKKRKKPSNDANDPNNTKRPFEQHEPQRLPDFSPAREIAQRILEGPILRRITKVALDGYILHGRGAVHLDETLGSHSYRADAGLLYDPGKVFYVRCQFNPRTYELKVERDGALSHIDCVGIFAYEQMDIEAMDVAV